MDTQLGFLLKILLLSAGVSILIKYGGPSLSIPATSAIALIAVLLPTLIMGITLWMRSRNYPQL